MSDTVKIVYNACFGGFGLSDAGVERYAKLKGLRLWPEKDPKFPSLLTTYWLVPPEERPRELDPGEWQQMTSAEKAAHNDAYRTLYPPDIKRTDPDLVRVVEELGAAANTRFSNLKIAEVPRGSRYRIDEYDGSESVETPDSYEWEIAE